MDEQSVRQTPETLPAQPADIANSDRRRRAQELLHSQRTQLDQLELALAERLQTLSEEVAREAARSATENPSAAVDRDEAADKTRLVELTEQLTFARQEVRRLGEEYERHCVNAGRLEQELRIREKLLADARSREESRHLELAAMTERLNHSQAEIAAARKQQESLRQELEAARAAFASQSEQLAGLSHVAVTLAQSQTECQRLAGQLKAVEVEQEFEAESRQLEAAELRESLAKAEREHQRLAELNHARNTAEDSESVKTWKLECESLAKKLNDAEEQLKRAGTSEADTRKKDDLQRRFEMAVEDLRETKRLNAELESKLAKARGGAPASPSGSGGLDWESQKRRLLESLEADDGDELSDDDRITIEGTIRITDQIVAQKDAEIAELNRLLSGQLTGSGPAAIGAAELASILDHDELIRQERLRLQQAEADWREKIGRAEIDISVERAKIARERAELEERGRQYQADQEQRGKQNETPEHGKAARGRWLARLGLKDLDDKSDA